jgi:hypothetical protein
MSNLFVGEWQPIETAPQDVDCLVWDGETVHIAMKVYDQWLTRPSPSQVRDLYVAHPTTSSTTSTYTLPVTYTTATTTATLPEIVFSMETIGVGKNPTPSFKDHFLSSTLHPTHWMPLPSRPDDDEGLV